MSDLRILPSAASAAGAYARVQNAAAAGGGSDDLAAIGQNGDGASGAGFGAALSTALQGAVSAGEAADKATAAGLSGHGDLTQVVMAVSRAQLALQTTTAIRDRVVSAYQDIMKMSI